MEWIRHLCFFIFGYTAYAFTNNFGESLLLILMAVIIYGIGLIEGREDHDDGK
jgi:hypothetical protein